MNHLSPAHLSTPWVTQTGGSECVFDSNYPVWSQVNIWEFQAVMFCTNLVQGDGLEIVKTMRKVGGIVS